MVMPVMKGGGAERVASLLMNEFHKQGHNVRFLLTSSNRDEVIRTDLNTEIPLVLLQEQLGKDSIINTFSSSVLRLFSSIVCKFYESMKLSVPGYFAYLSFISQYGREVKQLRKIMKENPELTVISFLQPSIPMVVLAARGLPNKINISERGNPERLMKKRYGKAFVDKYYRNIHKAVFQTSDAMNSYPKCVSDKSVVISNPIKNDLPEAYIGERNKVITTFCRISKQKNLPLLIEAFSMLHKEYPEYKLRIIGDTFNEEGIEVKSFIEKQIKELNLIDNVEFNPFSKNVHNEIIKDAMYVNSSDYEGISNAMLEAMAIGMPVVCTDCPVGGARAIIVDNYNGLLVKVGDVDGLFKAMKKVISEDELASRISQNAVEIRETLSLQNIAGKWMELV